MDAHVCEGRQPLVHKRTVVNITKLANVVVHCMMHTQMVIDMYMSQSSHEEQQQTGFRRLIPIDVL